MKRIFNNLKIKMSAGMLAMLMLVSISCEDILDIEPKQSIDFSTALNTRDGVVAAVNGVYSRLRSLRLYGRDLLLVGDALSDIGRATNNSGRLIGEYNNNNRAHFVQETWQQAYFAINEANLILEAISDLNDPLATQADKDNWTGSMKFIRALLHFELARIYAYDPGVIIPATYRGGIPIRITATRTVEEALGLRVPRDEVADVYAQIYADLDDAIAKLPASTNKYYANLGAAHALYSRVALYNKDYAKAESEATAALLQNVPTGVGQLRTGTDYVAGWRAAANPESYFEIRFQIAGENNGVNESLQTTVNSISSVAILGVTGAQGQVCTQGGWGDLVPNDALLTDLGMNLTLTGTTCNDRAINRTGTVDYRAYLYEVGNGRGSGNKIESIKYLGKSGLQNLDNAPIIRVAELFLNRAEAYATPGSPVLDETLAKNDLRTLKAARYVGYTGSAMETADLALTGTALLDEILRQRKLEFAFEGHRWFDLKRRGVDIVKLPATVAYADYRILAPLPQGELDGNENLEQNDGY